MSSLQNPPTKSFPKHAFITIGATATFPSLIRTILSPPCLTAFASQSFTHIKLQVGDSLPLFEEIKPRGDAAMGLKIKAFDFNAKGLGQEMLECKESTGLRDEGLVVSHAGAGTILDAMRLGLPLIVVPNETLLDNHQEELAEELERQGYVTKSNLAGLPQAIRKAGKRKEWGGESVSVAGIVNEMVGYEEETKLRLD